MVTDGRIRGGLEAPLRKLGSVGLICLLAVAASTAVTTAAFADGGTGTQPPNGGDSTGYVPPEDPSNDVPADGTTDNSTTDDGSGTVQSTTASNDPNVTCLKNGLGAGVYDPGTLDNGSGYFGLQFTPVGRSKVSSMTAAAVLCGSDETSGAYMQTVTLTYPGTGERIRCAVSKAPASMCPGSALPDGAVVGSAQLDLLCANALFCPSIKQIGPVTTTTRVRYKTAGPHKPAPNSCMPDPLLGKPIACFATESKTVLRSPISTGLTCSADIVVRRVDTTQPPTMTLYQPRCATNKPFAGKRVPVDSVYFLNIDSLSFCAYANLAKQSGPTVECGSKRSLWIAAKGRQGDYDFSLDAKLTDGTDQLGDAAGSWQS